MAGPLDGIRVVDCSTGTAGTRAGGMLADYGADVVWVEPPGGDRWRDELRIEYAVYNRGKRSVQLDLRGDGRTQLDDLLGGADVLIHSWRPGVAEDLGLTFEQLHDRYPHLVVCTVTGFGLDGPFRDVRGEEALVHALVGTMGEQVGLRDGPIFEGLPFASLGAAYLAAIGVLAALYRRLADGRGRLVETSLYDGALSYLAIFWGESDADIDARRDVSHGSHLPIGSRRLITGSFLCGDGKYLGVHTGAVGAFSRLMKVLKLDDRVPPSVDGHDMGTPLLPDEAQVINDEIHTIFASHPRAWWLSNLAQADVCAIPQLPAGEVFDEPQAKYNEMVVTLDDPVLGRIEQVAPPARFSVTSHKVARAAPGVDGNVPADILVDWQRDPSWVGDGVLDERPLLDGVHIVDLGAYFAGPYASRLLADLGADVVKVETIAGDAYRGAGRQFTTPQAGKRAIAVDLKASEADELRARLLRWADIVHHNMRPGAAERLGIGPDDARRVNPSVIYGHASGWGATGPFRYRQSFEPMMSGYVGVGFEVGGQFNPPMYPAGHADPANGLVGAVAMLLALLHRRRTGVGQDFENPQLNATMAQVAHLVRDRDGKVLGAGRLDPLQLGVGALERLYETTDGWVCIVVRDDDTYSRLARAVGDGRLTDGRYATPAGRNEHTYALEAILAEAFRTDTTSGWLRRFDEAAVPAAAPVGHNNHAFMSDPENRRTGRVAEHPHPTWGNVRELSQFIRFSSAQRPPHRVAPEQGQHTDEVLAELDFDDDQIGKLRAAGVVL